MSATRGLCACRLREVRVSLRVRPAVAFDCLFNSPFPPSVTNEEFCFYIKSTESFKQTKNLRFGFFYYPLFCLLENSDFLRKASF